MEDYKRLGYSDSWINQRLKSIENRKDLTDEWKKQGLSIPVGQWHTVNVLEPTVILECKDGPYEPLGEEDILELG